MRRTVFLGVLLAALLPGGSAQAKWGPFGRSTSFSGITICSVRLLKGQDTVTLYRDSLMNGNVQVSARVRPKVGTLEYSLDSGATWQPAVGVRPDLYLFRFPAAVGKTYQVSLRVITKNGPAGEVTGTVQVRDESIRDQVRAQLDRLVEAYCMKDRDGFRALTSQDFFPDPSLLEDALRDEMRLFDGMDIKTNIINVAASGEGRVYATVRFSRFYTSLLDGKNARQDELTQLVFATEHGGLKLYAMRAPLLFGVTREEELAVVAP